MDEGNRQMEFLASRWDARNLPKDSVSSYGKAVRLTSALRTALTLGILSTLVGVIVTPWAFALSLAAVIALVFLILEIDQFNCDFVHDLAVVMTVLPAEVGVGGIEEFLRKELMQRFGAVKVAEYHEMQAFNDEYISVEDWIDTVEPLRRGLAEKKFRYWQFKYVTERFGFSFDEDEIQTS